MQIIGDVLGLKALIGEGLLFVVVVGVGGGVGMEMLIYRMLRQKITFNLLEKRSGRAYVACMLLWLYRTCRW